MIITVIAVFMFMQSSLTFVDPNLSFDEFLDTRTWSLSWGAWMIFIVLAFGSCSKTKMRKKFIINSIILLVITICLSFIFAVFCQFFYRYSITNALLVSVFVTCGLTGFTFVHKKRLGLFVGSTLFSF